MMPEIRYRISIINERGEEVNYCVTPYEGMTKLIVNGIMSTDEFKDHLRIGWGCKVSMEGYDPDRVPPANVPVADAYEYGEV